MKKTLLIVIFGLSFVLNAKEVTIETAIYNRFFNENGILQKVYDKLPLCSHGEELYYIIKLNIDKKIDSKIIRELKRNIEKAFANKRIIYKTKCSVPESPFFINGGGKNLDLPHTSNKVYFVKHEIEIKLKRNSIVIKANNSRYFRYNKDGKENTIESVLDTHIDLEMPFKIERKQNIDSLNIKNENSNIIIDTAIDEFIKIQKDSIKNEVDMNFVKLNRRIFKRSIYPDIKKVAEGKVLTSIEKFLANFLGNAYTEYCDKIPRNIGNGKPRNYLITERIQVKAKIANENYSFFKIGASQKDCELIKSDKQIKIPAFGHWLTVKDTLIREISIGCYSETYLRDLFNPLTKIYTDTLGHKFYDDIIRFFLGLTTALTTEDFHRLLDYYHDIAIRAYFKGESTSEMNPRSWVFGNTSIIKHYGTLEKKGYEIYVTLNEGKYKADTSSVKIVLPDGERSLGYIIAHPHGLIEKFRQMPAFLLRMDMNQRWRTIRRFDQQLNLNDNAIVQFTLLCLNMQRLYEWLKESIEDDEFNRLTIFTFASYLKDLYSDMSEKEKKEFKKKYNLTHKYIKKNMKISEKIPTSFKSKNVEEIYKSVYNELVDINRFSDILFEVREFIESDLRKEVHNRRFLFNVCYLKILHQYTYDKSRKIIGFDKNDEYNLIQNIIKSKK